MMPEGLVDLGEYTVVKDWMERMGKREAVGKRGKDDAYFSRCKILLAISLLPCYPRRS